jgi:tyrosinase
MKRRDFLVATGTLATAAVLERSFFDVDAVQAATFVRKDIGGLSAADPIIKSYSKAIKAMKALPTTNPLSWTYQAAIHGTTLSGSHTSWNTCEHGTDYFWPWHRMYLYWFEEIIRHMSGDPGWSLPYWNWTSASERQLPSMFRDTTSELYTVNRNPAMNSGAGSLPSSDVDYSAAFAYLDFSSANGVIQGVPHGQVHVDVGGWMGRVPTAAQDPIFYLHHANMDRLWNLWLAQGGGRTDPVSNPTWKAKTYTFFDPKGKAVKMNDCEVLRAAQQLNYTYEGEPPQVKPDCLKIIFPWWKYLVLELVPIPVPPIILGPGPVEIPLDIPNLERMQQLAGNEKQKLLLQFDEVTTDKNPEASWEVYVGLPANAAANTESPFYVGNIVLFGAGIREEAHHGFTPAHFQFAVNRALLEAKKNNSKISLRFVPHGILIDGKPSTPQVQSQVHINKVSIAVTGEKEQTK